VSTDSLDELAALLGADNVLTDPESCSRAGTTWHPTAAKARLSGGDASPAFAAVVKPGSAAEVARVVAWAGGSGARFVPVGGGSNTVGSTLPATDDGRTIVALDLSRIDHVRWDEESLTAFAGAGLRLSDLEDRLNRHGYTLGHFPRSVGLATVGGAVATDAVGALSGRYGRQRDLTVGLEAVLPSGEIVRTSAHGSGAHLHPLLIGSEGALGVVTEAELAMSPLPDVRAWAPFSFAKTDDAFDALRLVYRSDARPAAARLFDPDAATRLSARGAAGDGRPALLLLGFEGSELVQTGAYQMAYAVCQQVGGAALDPEVGDAWFEERGSGAGLFAANARSGGLADVFSVWAPWGRAKAVHAAMRRAASPLVTALAAEVAHPSPQGAAIDLWWEAQAEPPTLAEATSLHGRVVEAVLSAALDAGAESAAHHWGVGPARRAFVERERGPAHTAALRAIKAAFDPNGVLPPLP